MTLAALLAASPPGSIKLIEDRFLEGATRDDGSPLRWVPIDDRRVLVFPSFMREIKERLR